MNDVIMIITSHPVYRKLIKVIQDRRFKFIICLLLCVWIAHNLASLFWVVTGGDITSETDINKANNSQAVSVKEMNFDLNSMKSSRVFGKNDPTLKKKNKPIKKEVSYSSQNGEIPDDAPLSKMPLTLTGVIMSSKAYQSRAFISSSGKTAVFKIDDKLPPNNQVVLVKVKSNYVILDNAGRYESLYLFDDKNKSKDGGQQAGNNRSTGISRSRSRFGARETINNETRSPQGSSSSSLRRSKAANKIKTLVQSKNAGVLSQSLKVSSTKTADGRRGYKMSPGKDDELFNDLGLKNNDIVVSVNGIEIGDPSQVTGLASSISSVDCIKVIVMRDGQPVELDYNCK
jgi:general secretion pathway protein C